MPLQRRIPKRGFTPRKRTVYQIVNVGELARIDGTTVNAEVLKEAGLIRSAEGLIKILAKGEVDRAYAVEAHKFSGRAVARLEAAGGSAEVVTRAGRSSATAAPKPAATEPSIEPGAERADVAEPPPAVEDEEGETETDG